MNINDIENFIENINLDIRIKGNNPRFLDQKCTPDVIQFVADIILDFNDENFDRMDVQKKETFVKLSTFVFGKPSPNNKNLRNEYDKFIGQNLEMFSYAGILNKSKAGRINKYKIVNRNILEYISVRPMNAYNFLVIYLTKFLRDSSVEQKYLNFFEKQTKESFELLKNSFENFLIKYSNIGSRGSSTGGSTEIRRIFPKLLNPLALKNNSKGTSKGRISKGIITSSELMYNSVNFRDKNKDKNISRKEQAELDGQIKGYNDYQITKAKQWIRKEHPYSEVNDDLYGKTADAHHIFPKSDFPQISYYIENLIALTGGQHKDRAHPSGNTQKIDISYQYICLRTKLDTIKNSLIKKNTEYSKDNFIFVLNTGFNWLNSEKEIEYKSNFDVIEHNIDLYYKTY